MQNCTYIHKCTCIYTVNRGQMYNLPLYGLTGTIFITRVWSGFECGSGIRYCNTWSATSPREPNAMEYMHACAAACIYIYMTKYTLPIGYSIQFLGKHNNYASQDKKTILY